MATKTCDNCGQVYNASAPACPWCAALEPPYEFPAGFCRGCGKRINPELPAALAYCVNCAPLDPLAPLTRFQVIARIVRGAISEEVLRQCASMSEGSALEVIRYHLVRAGLQIVCACRHPLELHDTRLNPAGICQEMTCFCLGLTAGHLEDIPAPAPAGKLRTAYENFLDWLADTRKDN